MQGGIVRSRTQCGLKFADGSIEISPLQVRNSQIAAIVDVIRLEPQRGLEFRDGAGRISYLDQRQPKVIVSIGTLRLRFDHVSKCRNRCDGVSLSLKQQTEL